MRNIRKNGRASIQTSQNKQNRNKSYFKNENLIYPPCQTTRFQMYDWIIRPFLCPRSYTWKHNYSSIKGLLKLHAYFSLVFYFINRITSTSELPYFPLAFLDFYESRTWAKESCMKAVKNIFIRILMNTKLVTIITIMFIFIIRIKSWSLCVLLLQWKKKNLKYGASTSSNKIFCSEIHFDIRPNKKEIKITLSYTSILCASTCVNATSSFIRYFNMVETSIVKSTCTMKITLIEKKCGHMGSVFLFFVSFFE